MKLNITTGSPCYDKRHGGGSMIRALYEVALDHNRGFDQQVSALLQMGCEQFSLGVGILARVVADVYTIENVYTELDLPLESGQQFELGSTYCCATLAADGPVGFHHAGGSDWATHPCYAAFGLEAYLGVPVRVNGEVWGTLNFSHPEARREPICALESDFIQLMAQWIGTETERAIIDGKLRTSRAELLAMHAASPLGMFMTDPEGLCLRVNQKYEEISGFPADEALGTGWLRAIHPDDRERVFHEWDQAARQGTEYQSIHRFRRPDDTVYWGAVKAAQMKDNDKVIGYVATVEDVTLQKQAEEEMHMAALRDGLTGLVNREIFATHVDCALERARNDENYCFAVLFLDFDQFKRVNDTLGHSAGDALLMSIAQRLRGNLRSGDSRSCGDTPLSLPARIGGDEFVVLLDKLDAPTDAEHVARRLVNTFNQPHALDGTDVVSTASIGITYSDHGYDCADDIIHDADLAMYHAKRQGKARYVIFDPSMRAAEEAA